MNVKKLDPTDDTLRTGRQAEEDTFNALLEGGQFGPAYGLESQDDVDRLYTEVTKVSPDLIFYKIPFEVSQRGEISGRACALVFQDMPEASHGKVILMFDGYADDPRELFQIPIVVEFCRGLLMGEHGTQQAVNTSYLWKLFSVLYNEKEAAFDEGMNLVDPLALKPAGQFWLIAHCFPDQCFLRRGGQWMQDWSLMLRLRTRLLMEGR